MTLNLAVEIVILNSAPTPEEEVSHEKFCLLSRFHHETDRSGELSPLRVLACQPHLSRRRQPVVLRFPIAIGHRLPACGDPAPFLQAIERRIERAVVHAQYLLGSTLDMRRDGVAMQRAEEQGTKDKHVKRPLKQFDALGRLLS